MIKQADNFDKFSIALINLLERFTKKENET